MASENFAKLNDVAPQDMKRTQERYLLPYVRCMTCKETCIIHVCGAESEKRCNEHGEAYHTHLLCACEEKVFSGTVTFRTGRDTDSYNKRKDMTWDEKKQLLKKK